MESIYIELQKLGFSQYECKAYIGLLKNSPVTGYEVSKRTGVPRSMIYEVLGKLLDKGAIYVVPSEPVKYSPIPAKDLIQRLRKSFEETFDILEQQLPSIESERETDVIWNIRSHEHVIEEMQNMIRSAKNELWLSVWEKQVPQIKEAVDERVKEGIHIFTILFGAPDTQLGLTFHHNYMPPDVVKKRMGGHLTVAARDGEEVLIANFTERSFAWAVKTTDPALVLIATEYIRHDIMIEEITKEFGADKLDALWRTNIDLSHVVKGNRFK
ncbi:helix-turn-helix domain-containing protein [Caldifermentibacillus hisashii]|uniref:TrmB family transcriptional regulator n=1 Tax=Caldifermentibacillus hisashii TaxID=996558 RepID=UPI0031B6B15C